MINDIKTLDVNKLKETGIEINSDRVNGTVLINNKQPFCDFSRQEGVTVLNIKQALEKYGGLGEYFWQAINPQKDEFTQAVFTDLHEGYFVRSEKGIKSAKPVQTCLYISRSGFQQNIHNIIIAEEGSTLSVITGCLTGGKIKGAKHIGVTEIYVKKNARIVFTMIHNWDETAMVRPRTAIKVEKGGRFTSNYICLKPVGDIQMYPVCELNGDISWGNFNSYIYAHPGSKLDLGGKIVLNGEGSRGEITYRSVNNRGIIYNRGNLIGIAKGIKAHMDCRGLIMKQGGTILAIPELEARTADVDMTHEASIGRVAEEQIEYLKSRGMSEEEAVEMIIKGFLDTTGVNIPALITAQLTQIKLIGH
jgi:Fe-S cluster assembly scaffold protein SufB